jgi:hypothetical protein
MSNSVRCVGCGQQFEVWTNEWFCSDECRLAWPEKQWPRAKFSEGFRDTSQEGLVRFIRTRDEKYWDGQRANDNSFALGRADALAGRKPIRTDDYYRLGYNSEEGDKPTEGAKA